MPHSAAEAGCFRKWTLYLGGRFTQELLGRMTLKEKIAQLSQLPGTPIPEFKEQVGSMEDVIRKLLGRLEKLIRRINNTLCILLQVIALPSSGRG